MLNTDLMLSFQRFNSISTMPVEKDVEKSSVKRKNPVKSYLIAICTFQQQQIKLLETKHLSEHIIGGLGLFRVMRLSI